jgi:hypothetical protein
MSGTTTAINVNIPTTANDPLRTVRLRNLSLKGIGVSGTVGTRVGMNAFGLSQAPPLTRLSMLKTHLSPTSPIEASALKLTTEESGVLSGPGTVVIRLSANSVQNNATGVNVSSGTVVTYGTNRINDNTSADVTGVLTAAGAASSQLGTR